MNRSYRTIWNESLGAWVAASEVTKAKGKRSRQGRTMKAGDDVLHAALLQPSVPAPPPYSMAQAVAAVVLGSLGLVGGAMAQGSSSPPPICHNLW